MKETFYFAHDYNARNDPKLQNVLMEHGCAGIGVFWCIVEQLHEQDGILPLAGIKGIAFALHVDVKVVESIIRDFDLFQADDENFWSESVNKRLQKRDEIKDKRTKAAQHRWAEKCKCNANAMQMQCKEKEIKEKEIIKEREKEKTAQRFVPPTVEEVKARIAEMGYTFDAEAFLAFYQSNGWMVGKSKMKDWRAAMVTWQKREQKIPRGDMSSSISKKANEEW